MPKETPRWRFLSFSGYGGKGETDATCPCPAPLGWRTTPLLLPWLICAAGLLSLPTAAHAGERQVLKGHVPAPARYLQPRERLAPTNRLELVIALPLRNRPALEDLLHALYDPGSTHYHRYLTPSQFADQFGPTPQDYAAVIQFATANGLKVTGTHPNRTALNVSGSVADIEKALHVKLHRYEHPTEARTFYAPDSEPSLDLQVPVLMVAGLDDFRLPRPAGLRLTPLGQSGGVAPEGFGSGPRGFLMGRDFRAAYAEGVTLNGAGQAIGLMEFDGYYTNDIVAYENLAGLPTVPLTNVLIGLFNGRPGGGNAEVVLDIDMAICMAPGLSKVIVYEASLAANPYDVLNRMANDTNSLGQVVARQLSSSWTWSIASTEAQNQVFQQFAAQGQSFLQASTDDGAYCGVACVPGTPADNPNVTVVGGTTLTTASPTGGWVSEKAWSYFPGQQAATGGGFGTNYAIPSWQQGIDMTLPGGSTSLRNSPDVACVADGLWLVADNGQQYNGAGTSASAPLWCGLAALVNQQAQIDGQPPLGLLNPVLYAIGKSSLYASTFHDITSGNNTNTCCAANLFYACPGYDLCTGWGTPIAGNLIPALLAPPVPLTITPTVPLAFSGPLGGPFQPAAGTFVLTNDTSVPISWTLTRTNPWIKALPNTGTLTNGGPSVSVTVTPSPSATNLPVGSYTAVLWFTNLNDGTGQSRLVTLDVVVPPVIASQPVSQSVLVGQTATFTVALSNSASCSFQWLYDNGSYVTNLTDGGPISGAASGTLSIANVMPADAGAYRVTVTNAAGSVTSQQAFLGVLPWRPVITTQPTNVTAQAGQAVTFTISAVGSPPLYYRWQRNGVPLSEGGNVSGSASPSLNLRSASPADAATYSVNVSNATGQASSLPAVLTVIPITAPAAALTTVYSFTGGADGANPNALVHASNLSFYGTAQYGGSNYSGTVFQLSPNGAFSVVYAFTGTNDGATPLAGLMQGPDGNFYGTTYQGGAYDNGTAFSLTPGGVLSNLISLNITNGSFPYCPLTLGPDGYFYGTTYQGGAGRSDYVFRPGEVFKVSSGGSLTLVRSFTNGLDGGFPAAGVTLGSDGSLYGMTSQGGARSNGVVYKVTANGLFTTLAVFNKTNGSLPLAELVQDVTGNFYGTTAGGGAYGNGTAFRMSPTGVLTTLYSFGGGADGSYPAAALLLGSDGNFYGTTAYGGAYGYGTLFRMGPDGTLNTLVAFNGYAGANPQAVLTQDTDGSLYGTTQNGGANNVGVIFHLGFTGPPQITVQPASQSVYGGDTVFLSVVVTGAGPLSYQWQQNGTSLSDTGNVSGSGARVLTLTNVVLTNAGSYSVLISNSAGSTNSATAVLHVLSSPPLIVTAPTNVSPNACSIVTLNVTAVGNKPINYQWQKNGVNLVDSCGISGSTNTSLIISNITQADNGTYNVVVKNPLGTTNVSALVNLVPNTAACTSLTTWHWFSGGSDGSDASALSQGTNGVLYGTTYNGGAHPWGTVFSLTTNGAFSTLLSFVETNGANPAAPPVQGADGNLYGTTVFAGPAGAGTVFAMTAGGALSTVYPFSGGADGANPYGPLLQSVDGNLYGMASAGGTSGFGCVFRVSPNGAFTNLHSFTGGLDGQSPKGGLVQAADGNFYGLTPTGGASGQGNFFRITPTGALTTLYSFTGGNDGGAPAPPLALGSDGNFYGTATQGGLGRRGTVFKLTPSGTLTTLHAFGDLILHDGIYPLGGVVQSSDGNLYGTTYADYQAGYGTVFRVSPDGSTFATLVYFDGCDDGSRPQTALFEDAAGDLYGTTSAGGPCQGGQGTVFQLTVGCAPQIITQPASQAVSIGANVQFSVAVTGARPLYYQWQRNGTNLLDGGNISGSTNRSLNLAAVSLADAATYSVNVSNSLSAVPSSPAHLTVVYPPVFLSATASNCTLALTYSTIPGQKYRLQYKSTVTNSTWAPLGPFVFPTSNTVTAYDNPCTNSQRLYRVVLMPQIQ
ncbi:MAG TPA: choice-of-anchor tandem repeat GloVer-containing protein [Candidatus Acidoferrum sp.]|nr:choice-of-anchor tandem repeat GloVer-containing protein [Candidatus Acidoferrum sp.]